METNFIIWGVVALIVIIGVMVFFSYNNKEISLC